VKTLFLPVDSIDGETTKLFIKYLSNNSNLEEIAINPIINLEPYLNPFLEFLKNNNTLTYLGLDSSLDDNVTKNIVEASSKSLRIIDCGSKYSDEMYAEENPNLFTACINLAKVHSKLIEIVNLEITSEVDKEKMEDLQKILNENRKIKVKDEMIKLYSKKQNIFIHRQKQNIGSLSLFPNPKANDKKRKYSETDLELNNDVLSKKQKITYN
jgi:hypothetical protein